MTKDEAMAKLDDLRDEVYNEDSDGYAYAQAIDIAIETLTEPNKAVPPSLADIYKWERDIALSQLEEYGIGFAEKKRDDLVEVVRCKDCIHRIDRRSDLGHFMCEMFYGQGDVSDENFCQWGERRNHD